MKKISYEDLGKYIGNKASLYFNRWYSKEIKDYIEDVIEEYIEEKDLYYNYIEIYEIGKSPLIISFYSKYINDINGNIVYKIYYID